MQTPSAGDFDLASRLVLVFFLPFLVYLYAFRTNILKRDSNGDNPKAADRGWLQIGPWMATISFGYVALLSEARANRATYFIVFLVLNLFVLHECYRMAGILDKKLFRAGADELAVSRRKFVGYVVLSFVVGCIPLTVYVFAGYYWCLKPAGERAAATEKADAAETTKGSAGGARGTKKIAPSYQRTVE